MKSHTEIIEMIEKLFSLKTNKWNEYKLSKRMFNNIIETTVRLRNAQFLKEINENIKKIIKERGNLELDISRAYYSNNQERYNELTTALAYLEYLKQNIGGEKDGKKWFL